GEFHQVFNDEDDIILGQCLFIQREINIQFAVDLVTAYFTEVITFIAEEEFVNDTTGGFIIGSISATELAVDELNRFEFAVGCILVQCAVDDSIITTNIFTLDEYAFHIHFSNGIDCFFIENGIALHHDLVSFGGNNFTGVFI